LGESKEVALKSAPIVDGIQAVFFYVHDMNRALAFYEGLLGLPVQERSPTWSSLDCGGVRLGLHLVDPADRGPAANGAVVSFRVSDARAAQQRLREAGAKVGEVSEEPYGLLVHLEDPDGHSLRLLEPRRG
jgi:predicted enzyme related to lactoylglutathione lyase